MIKREKSFFHLATKFTNEERKMFFFIQLLRSLRHDEGQKSFFFHLATTITTPYSRLKRENSFLHLATMFIKEERKKIFFFYSLQSLRHDPERNFFFI